jgi:hypothetical protein
MVSQAIVRSGFYLQDGRSFFCFRVLSFVALHQSEMLTAITVQMCLAIALSLTEMGRGRSFFVTSFRVNVLSSHRLGERQVPTHRLRVLRCESDSCQSGCKLAASVVPDGSLNLVSKA